MTDGMVHLELKTPGELLDEIVRLRAALQFIADGYDNHDVNHVDFRVKSYQVALDALAFPNGEPR